jgi:hypothetical protein
MGGEYVVQPDSHRPSGTKSGASLRDNKPSLTTVHKIEATLRAAGFEDEHEHEHERRTPNAEREAPGEAWQLGNPVALKLTFADRNTIAAAETGNGQSPRAA